MMFKAALTQSWPNYYVAGSRWLTHVLFWMVYYLSFSLIWSYKHGLFESFYLEFLLLPVRMLAAYTVIYGLMPLFLLRQRYVLFLFSLVGLLLLSAVLQRVVLYFFYESLLLNDGGVLFAWRPMLRSAILTNTTVMLVMTIRLIGLYRLERARNSALNLTTLVIKADRRTHLVHAEDILFIQGLGNYVNVYLKSGEKLTTYRSLKSFLDELPVDFVRCHKSFVINKRHVRSFNAEDIQIGIHTIPRGAQMNDDQLLPEMAGSDP